MRRRDADAEQARRQDKKATECDAEKRTRVFVHGADIGEKTELSESNRQLHFYRRANKFEYIADVLRKHVREGM
jgi:hypothetical protein